MASIGHWNRKDSDDSWDYCVLGGKFLPGVARVKVGCKSDLDTKKPKGAKCATITDKGDHLANVEIELVLEDDEDLTMLEAQLPNLRPRTKGVGREPLEIVHPNPNFWGITAVTVNNISAPQPDAVDGWVITISCIEWAPEPIKVKPKKNKKPTPKGETKVGPWAQMFLDDDDAGSGNPVANDAAQGNSGMPNSRSYY